MNKFLFKSADPSDLSKNIINKLDMLLTEQRKQRSDLSILTRMLNGLINTVNLQKQVDEFFEDDKDPLRPEPPLEDMAQDGNSSSS